MNLEQDGQTSTHRPPATGALPALFLDRDGVIVENRASYVRAWSDVEIYPQALAALARLHSWPGRIVVVTNQSVVGRGLISLQAAEDINKRLLQEIQRHGGRVDAVFMCPHAPSERCHCRKPQPGLLLQAIQQLGLDASRSIMLGDALSDLLAGRAAGVSRVALLETGRGRKQLALPAAAAISPYPVFATLFEAVDQLLFAEILASTKLNSS